MATTKLVFASTAAASVITDTDSDTTVEANVNTGAGQILMVTIKNSVNTGPVTTVFWDRTADPGYDDSTWAYPPIFCLYAPASTDQTYVFPQGVTFTNGISFATTTSGGSNRGSNPTNNVEIQLMMAATDLTGTP